MALLQGGEIGVSHMRIVTKLSPPNWEEIMRILICLLSVVLADCGGASATESASGTVAPSSVEVTQPDWATLNHIYSGTRTSIGGYPVNAEFGLDSTGIVQGMVGAVQIPSSMTAPNHSAGVAGYARTNSTQNMAVGVHGFGGVLVDGGQAEGGHFLTTNCGAQSCSPGFNAADNYIIEADINMMRTASGNPTGNAFGLVMFGASNATPQGLFQAIHIDSPGVFQSPPIPWKEAFSITDGAASVAMTVGKLAIGDTSDSQPIHLRSSAHGVERTSVIQSTAPGDVVVRSGSGTMVVDGWGIRILKAQTPISSNTSCVTGQMQWDSGFTYVCVDTNHWKRSALADF